MNIARLERAREYLDWLAQQHGDQNCDKCDVVSYAELEAMPGEQREAYAPFNNKNGAVRRCLVCAQHFPYVWARDLDPWRVAEFVDQQTEAVPVETLRAACS